MLAGCYVADLLCTTLPGATSVAIDAVLLLWGKGWLSAAACLRLGFHLICFVCCLIRTADVLTVQPQLLPGASCSSISI